MSPNKSSDHIKRPMNAFMVFSQILASHKHFQQIANMQLLVNRVSDALRCHLLPFLIESGYSFASEA